MRTLIKSLFKGLGLKIFLSFALLIAFMAVAVGFAGYKFVEKNVLDNASNELRVMSVTLSRQLLSFLKRIESSHRSLSSLNGFLDTELSQEFIREKRLAHFLNEKLAQSRLFEMLAVTDSDGRVLAATESDWVGDDLHKENYFTRGMERTSFAEVFEDKESQEKILLISGPIGDSEFPVGVLVARVKLESIYELMDQKLAVTGDSDAFLLDGELRFITPGKSAPDELLKSHLTSTPLVSHLKDEFWVGRYRNFESSEVLGTVFKLPELQWYLVVERDYVDVKKQLADFKRSISYAVVALIGALLVVTVVLTHSITRPIQTLVRGVQEMADGKLDRPFTLPEGAEEVVFLGSEFDKMRRKLARFQGELIEKLEVSEKKRLDNERLAAIGTMASSLAHEIRNPLNAMALLLAKYERSHDLAPSQATLLTSMKSEIGRLDRLVSDILDYARPLHLNQEKIDLVQFIDELVAFYTPTLDKKSLKIQTTFSQARMEVTADRDKLRQAMVNIIQNAIDASREGGTIRVEVEQRDAHSVSLLVSDHGSGIPDVARSKLFDLFFTTKERGTGLGLSTVKKIVDAHGGEVGVESQMGQGTNVRVHLPLHSQI